MQLKRIATLAAASTALVLLTATSASAAADTTDGTTLGAYCGFFKYGTIGWNDYADDDHGDDIDNVVVYDQPNDGESIYVWVKNHSNGRTNSGHAYSRERLSLDVGNVDNGDYVTVIASRWNNGSPNCESEKTTAYFYE